MLAVLATPLVFSLAAAALWAEQIESQEPLDIGSRLELFVDDYLIDSMNGVRLRLHEPRSAGKALVFDKPWEGNTSSYVNIFQDEDRLRMYYRGSTSHGSVQTSFLEPGEVVVPDHPRVIAYAESRDGVTWKRPALGIYEFQGSKENSIVWMDAPGENTAGCMYVFKDENPAALASQRYKAVASSDYPLVALEEAARAKIPPQGGAAHERL